MAGKAEIKKCVMVKRPHNRADVLCRVVLEAGFRFSHANVDFEGGAVSGRGDMPIFGDPKFSRDGLDRYKLKSALFFNILMPSTFGN